MSMEMSAKDKKLLVYLVAVAILALAYFFGTRPFLDKKETLQNQVDNLQREVNELTEIYNNQETYVARIAEEKGKFENALEKFPGGMTQENTLMMLQGIEDKTNTWISRVSFSEVQYISGSGGSDDYVEAPLEESETAEELEDSNPEDVSGDNINVSGISTMRQDLSLDYSCSYRNFKDFINYIEHYDSRLFISSINAVYSTETNEVSGAVTLSQFAVSGAGKSLEKPDLSGLSLGVDNIFTTLKGTNGSEPLHLGELNIGEEGEAEGDENAEGEEGEEVEAEE